MADAAQDEQQPPAMETGEGETNKRKPGDPKLELSLLEVIKTNQQRNGLQHRDFRRYRQFCARRLRRIRTNKAVEFKHGNRGPFVQRELLPEDCTDVKFLYIPLVNAERAWAYAMQLKDEEQSGSNSRKRLHLVRRLSKAVQWANKLRDLCGEVADDRTSLESEAYAAWMSGNMYLEKEEWKLGLVSFEKANSVYEQLSTVGSPEYRELMSKRVEDDCVPWIRYCKYYFGREGSGDSADLEQLSGLGNELLDAKIKKVLENTRKEQSTQATTISWKGEEILVRSQETRFKILEVRDRKRKLDERSSSSPDDAESERVFLESLSLFDDTLSIIRTEQQKMIKQSGHLGIEKLEAEFLALLQYVKFLKLQVVFQCKFTAALELQKELDPREVETSKVQPQDMFLVFDRLLPLCTSMCDLLGDSEVSTPDDMSLSTVQSYMVLCKAYRTYAIGWTYMLEFKWAEALALFEHNQSRIADALASGEVDGKQRELLTHIEAKTRGASCLALAQSFKSRLNSSTSKTTDEEIQICALPPPIEPVPCHPVVFDLAYTKLKFGNIKTKKKEKPSAKGHEEKQDQAEEQGSGWLNSARGWFSRR